MGGNDSHTNTIYRKVNGAEIRKIRVRLHATLMFAVQFYDKNGELIFESEQFENRGAQWHERQIEEGYKLVGLRTWSEGTRVNCMQFLVSKI
jgi:hypothetical protein